MSIRRCLVALAFVCSALPVDAQRRTEHVVLIVTDGVRWQEVFRGAERRFISREEGGVADTATTLREFWREDEAARRAALMPFLWGEVARQGAILGNQDLGSVMRVVNRHRFSYPGYAELLTGFADDRIDSNEYPPNPNVTVLEWLARRPGFEGKVGAVATWNVFRNILNEPRAGIDVLDGWDEPFPGALGEDPRRALVNELYRTSVKYWPWNTFDAPMHLAAKEYIRLRQPRVLFIGYGETDEWAHARRYDLALQSLHQVDAYIADLWRTLQGLSQYRGKTTFIITTDHGRGSRGSDWTSHGERVSGAEDIWMAVIGPDTPAIGEVRGGEMARQAQIAATIAALLGLDGEYSRYQSRAEALIHTVLRDP